MEALFHTFNTEWIVFDSLHSKIDRHRHTDGERDGQTDKQGEGKEREASVMVHAWNPSTGKAEAGLLPIQGQPRFQPRLLSTK